MTKKNQTLLTLGILLVITISSYRAFSLPYDYFAPQYFLNYQEGFIKRGLIGTINLLIFKNSSYEYNSIVIIATLLLAILLFLLCLIFSKTNPDNRVAWLAFLASPGFFYILNANGSFDIPCYIIAITYGLYCKKYEYNKLITLFILGITSLLIHEGSLLTTIPLMLFFYISSEEKWDSTKFKEFSLTTLSLILISILISQFGLISTNAKQALFINAQLKADFSPYYYPFFILDHNISDNLFTAYTYYFTNQRRIAVFYCIALTLPLLFLCLTRIKKNRILIIVFCYIPPLLMHLIGTDYMRWSAFSMLNTFIAFTFSEAKQIEPHNKPIYWIACVAMATFYLYSPYPVRSGELRNFNDLSNTKKNIDIFIKNGPQAPINPNPNCRKKLPNGLWCTFSEIKK